MIAGRKLILFDVDGTLVDSQAHIYAAMVQAFASEGLPPPPLEAVRRGVGLSLTTLIPQLMSTSQTAQSERMVEAYKEAFASLRASDDPRANSPFFEGIRAVLDAFAASERYVLGAATGKSKRGLDHVLDLHDLRGHFETLQTGDMHPSKPHPAMVQAALRETGVAAENTVLVGDTSFDMEMAKAAGVWALGVSWGYHPADELIRAGADRIVEVPRDIPAVVQELWSTTDG